MTSEKRFHSALGIVLLPYLVWYVITSFMLAQLPLAYQLLLAIIFVIVAVPIALLAATSDETPANALFTVAFMSGGTVGGWNAYAEKIQHQSWYEGLNHRVMLLITLALMIALVGEYWMEIRTWSKARPKWAMFIIVLFITALVNAFWGPVYHWAEVLFS